MFRVKKDDYNTVELIPEYRSTTKNKNSSMQSRTKSMYGFVPVLIVIVALAVLAGAGFGGYYLYKNYVNVSSQYVTMFESENWDACETLMKENEGNESFMEDIKAPVTDLIYQVQRDYKAGDINAEDALKALANYDKVTANHFTEITESISSFINNNEKLKADLDSIREFCSSNDISSAYEAIVKLRDDAAAYGIDVSEDVTSIIKDNLDAFKYVYFRQAATAMYNRTYDNIRTVLKTLNGYVNDSDITDMLDTIDKAEKGDLSRSKSRAYALEKADTFGQLISGITSTSKKSKADVTSTSSGSDTTSTEAAGTASTQSSAGSSAGQSSGSTQSSGADTASGTEAGENAA